MIGKSNHAYIHIYTYIFTDLSSAQVGLNVEFIMKRAKLDALFLSVFQVKDDNEYT
jgi:hypothetical protein